MSLKAVELQVAIPRTQELGRQQENHQQRLWHEQQSIIAERNQEDQHNRVRTQELEKSAKGYNKEDRERERRKSQEAMEQWEESKQAEARKPHVPMKDPLRGRHVDISL